MRELFDYFGIRKLLGKSVSHFGLIDEVVLDWRWRIDPTDALDFSFDRSEQFADCGVGAFRCFDGRCHSLS